MQEAQGLVSCEGRSSKVLRLLTIPSSKARAIIGVMGPDDQKSTDFAMPGDSGSAIISMIPEDDDKQSPLKRCELVGILYANILEKKVSRYIGIYLYAHQRNNRRSLYEYRFEAQREWDQLERKCRRMGVHGVRRRMANG
jgi:hypothetical protein